MGWDLALSDEPKFCFGSHSCGAARDEFVEDSVVSSFTTVYWGIADDSVELSGGGNSPPRVTAAKMCVVHIVFGGLDGHGICVG